MHTPPRRAPRRHALNFTVPLSATVISHCQPLATSVTYGFLCKGATWLLDLEGESRGAAAKKLPTAMELRPLLLTLLGGVGVGVCYQPGAAVAGLQQRAHVARRAWVLALGRSNTDFVHNVTRQRADTLASIVVGLGQQLEQFF